MQTLNIYRAQPSRDEGGQPLTVAIAEVIPEVASVEEAAARFNDQGAALAAALWDALPGGTVDALLSGLFARKASLFRVSFGQSREVVIEKARVIPQSEAAPSATPTEWPEVVEAMVNGGASAIVPRQRVRALAASMLRSLYAAGYVVAQREGDRG